MYEFQEIDGGWRICWGPPAKGEEPKPTSPDKIVVVPCMQVESCDSLEIAVAA